MEKTDHEALVEQREQITEAVDYICDDIESVVQVQVARLGLAPEEFIDRVANELKARLVAAES